MIYDSLMCDYSKCYSMNNVPMIVEASGGAWGTDARRVWRAVAQASSKLTGDPVATKLEQYYQSLSIALHRANARAILRRPPERRAVSPAVAAAQSTLAGAAADRAMGAMLLDADTFSPLVSVLCASSPPAVAAASPAAPAGAACAAPPT